MITWGDLVEGSPAAMRREAIETDFVPYVRRVFAKDAKLRSAMLVVAQYWADEADDAVHASVVFSRRNIPSWPHTCDWEGDDPSPERERCSSCGDYDLMPWDDNGSSITAFQACCREDGSQETDMRENYLPYVVACRGERDEVELFRVGGPIRAWLDGDGAAQPAAPPERDDPETRALFDLVYGAPEDDRPRQVLADHLQQRGDPLGEYLALVLAGGATDKAAVAARVRELEARHGRAWLGPLAAIAHPEHVVFGRGFPRELRVHVPDDAVAAAVRGVGAWGTVELLRFLPASRQPFSRAMTALRDVGPLDANGLSALAGLGGALRIERVHVVIEDGAMLLRLVEAALPGLRTLAVGGQGAARPVTAINPFTREEITVPGRGQTLGLDPASLDPLTRASYWKQLERLDLATSDPQTITAWLARDPARRPATMTFWPAGPGGDMNGFRLRVSGARRAVVDMPSLGAEAGLDDVGNMLRALPRSVTDIAVEPTRWYTPTEAELSALSEAAGRKVRIGRP